ncbi:MAG: site-2 protease family protein [Cyanothece sp. SIO1E1]|nr:site-2 protease family protein [Cyanothece sp. SIO1E1]
MNSGWRIGSIFGIPLFLDSSWFIILTFVTFIYGSAWQQNHIDWSIGLAWGAGLVTALLLFSSVLLHELGHSLVALSQGIKVNSITLFLFGGIASIDRESKTPGGAFQVAIAGPLVSLALFGMLTLLNSLSASSVIDELTGSVAQINLVLALFNLIPGLPLDGGQVLKAAVWKFTGNRFQGVRWAARIGQTLGWSAIFLGVTAYLTSQRFDLLWIALIGWFGVRNANAYNRVTNLQEALLRLKAEDAMTREFRVVDANMTLRRFADEYLLTENRPSAYFAASEGRYRGLVSADDLRIVERSRWEEQPINTIVKPLMTIPIVRESTPITEVIDKLEKQDLSRITVLSPADAVAGVIDRGDIVRALAKKLNLQISESIIQNIKDEGAYPPGLQLQAIAKAADE